MLCTWAPKQFLHRKLEAKCVFIFAQSLAVENENPRTISLYFLFYVCVCVNYFIIVFSFSVFSLLLIRSPYDIRFLCECVIFLLEAGVWNLLWLTLGVCMPLSPYPGGCRRATLGVSCA